MAAEHAHSPEEKSNAAPKHQTSLLGAPHPDGLATETLLRSPCTSFKLLFIEHRRIAQELGIRHDTINSHLSQTRRFLTALGLDESADPKFIADETKFIAETERASKALGFAAGSASARGIRSAVNRIRATFKLRLEDELTASTPGTFPDFWSAYLHYGMIASKLGYLKPHTARGWIGRPRCPNRSLLRSLGIHCGTISALKSRARSTISGSMQVRFEKLEKLLRAPQGSLTRHLTFRCGRVVDPSRRTKHSSRYSAAAKFRYAISVKKWPDRLQKELHEFLTEKRKTRWTTRQDGYSGTADRVVGMLEAFVGWLCLPINEGNQWRSGAGRSAASIQSVFAELVTPGNLDRYCEFRLAHTVTEEQYHAGDHPMVFNSTIRGLYHLAAHLLKPPHKLKSNRPAGFVFRNPDLYAKLLELHLPTSSFDRFQNRFVSHTTLHEQWTAFCEKTRSACFDTLDGAKETGKIGTSRSTTAGIEEILALHKPRTAIRELLDALRNDYEGYSWELTPYDKAFNCRRQLFVELIAIVPHRVRIWAVLTKSGLTERTNANGQPYFHLHIKRSEFKNHRYLDVDYDLDLPPRLAPLIQTYFTWAWPILNAPIGTFQEWRDKNHGAISIRDGQSNTVPIAKDPRYATLKQISPTDRVFGTAYGTSLKPQNRTVQTPEHKTRTIIQSLQRLMACSTGRFLGARYKTNGFYPHALRHIIATDEIKQTGSYERAALLLWDSVEMVMTTYGHVKKSDLLAGVVAAQESEYVSEATIQR
jgi:hypothetical protein